MLVIPRNDDNAVVDNGGSTCRTASTLDDSGVSPVAETVCPKNSTAGTSKALFHVQR